MIELIEKVLKESSGVSAYKIIESHVISSELFYVKKQLETSRATDNTFFHVVIYHDFDKYRGEASFTIQTWFTEEDIRNKVDDAIYEASFVKNQYFELPKPSKEKVDYPHYNLEDKPFADIQKDIVKAVFKADAFEHGSLNATEIFLYHKDIHIINSSGVDIKYSTYNGEIETIPSWEGTKGKTETYKNIKFGNVNTRDITNQITEALVYTRDKYEAKKMPKNKSVKVILHDKEVIQLFHYFVDDLSYGAQYMNTALFQLNKSVQGDENKGDSISITLKPNIKESFSSRPVDSDGIILKDLTIIENGVAVNKWGDAQHGYYIGAKKISGLIPNISVKVGKKTHKAMTSEPYLECVSFSDMQLDSYNGFIGGEVRLAYYYDGEKVIPVTGLTISGNMKEIKSNLVLSKEQLKTNGYEGPKYLEINGFKIC